jgi:hypothetical protein
VCPIWGGGGGFNKNFAEYAFKSYDFWKIHVHYTLHTGTVMQILLYCIPL